MTDWMWAVVGGVVALILATFGGRRISLRSQQLVGRSRKVAEDLVEEAEEVETAAAEQPPKAQAEDARALKSAADAASAARAAAAQNVTGGRRARSKFADQLGVGGKR